MSAPKTAAYQMLIRSGITRLPITFERIKAICKSHGWLLRSYSAAKDIIEMLQLSDSISGRSGLSYISDDTVIILYDDSMSAQERLFVVAHEIGHISLDHTGYGVLGKSNDPDIESRQEQEADDFAYYFLAPPCVIKRYHVRQLAELHNLVHLDDDHLCQSLSYLYKDDNEAVDELSDETSDQFARQMGQYRWSRYKSVVIAVIITIVISACITVPLLIHYYPTNTIPYDPTPIVSEGTQEHNVVTPRDSENIVYVTQAGEKYHRPDCTYIYGRENVRSMTIQEAIDAGYDACKVCDP